MTEESLLVSDESPTANDRSTNKSYPSYEGESTESDYSSYDLQFWHNLFTDDIITLAQGDEIAKNRRGFTIEFEKVVEKVKAIPQTFHFPDSSTPTSDEELRQTEVRAKDLFPQVVDTFVKLGIIPTTFMPQLDRLITAEDIQAVGVDWGVAGQFLYRHHSFPETSGQKAVLLMGTNTKGFEEALSSQLSELDVQLSDTIVKDIVLRWIQSHEYGHAVHKALLLRAGEIAAAKDLHADIPSLFRTIQDQMNQDVEMIIGIDEELNELIGYTARNTNQNDEEVDDFHEHVFTGGMIAERIATGFELLGLRAALVDIGIDSEAISALTQTQRDRKQNRFNQLARFINERREAGFSIDLLEEISSDIWSHIYHTNEDLLSIFPEFEVRTLGYEKPLSEEALKELVSKYSGEE